MKWIQARNVHTGSSTGNTFPTNILEVEQPCSVIDQILAAFVFEARQGDGNYYPGATIRNMLAALLRVMKQQGAANVVNFVDKSSREKITHCSRMPLTDT